MQNPEIDQLVELVASQLGRGLSLEDLDGLLLAYSSNQSHADRVRVKFLLSKRVPADVAAWQLSHGIAAAVHPVVIPANTELGMLGRVCVPLLVRGFRVGYLWVQQEEQEVSATAILAELPQVADSLTLLATLLLDSNTAESSTRRDREQNFLQAADGEKHAIESVADWREIYQLGPWCVATVFGLGVLSSSTTDPLTASLIHRSAGLQATIGVDDALFTAGRASHMLAVFRASQSRAVYQLVANRFAEELSKRTGESVANVVMGVSEPFATMRQLPTAYGESKIAAQAAAVDPELGNILDIRGAGAYEILAGGQAHPEDSVFYRTLRARDTEAELLPVLETLYDHDGGVAEVAARLHLHRSSIYNRLNRVRRIIGVDPMAGRVRLELHLALKAGRWAGRPRL